MSGHKHYGTHFLVSSLPSFLLSIMLVLQPTAGKIDPSGEDTRTVNVLWCDSFAEYQ